MSYQNGLVTSIKRAAGFFALATPMGAVYGYFSLEALSGLAPAVLLEVVVLALLARRLPSAPWAAGAAGTRVLFWVRSSVARLAWGEGLLLRSSDRRPICGRARRNRIGSCSHRLGRDGVEPPGRLDRRHGWDVPVGQASIRQ